jgi:DNA polymerase III delta subunit
MSGRDHFLGNNQGSSGELCSVHLLLGDLGRVRQEVERITSAFLPEGVDAINFFRFDAEESGELPFAEAENISFFSPKKMIVVGGLERASTLFLETLLSYLEQPNESICVVLYGDKINTPKRGSNIAAQVKRKSDLVGVVVDYNKIKSSPVQFVRAAAVAVHKSFVRGADRRVIDLIGESTALLQFELDKLFSFVGARSEITIEDVEQICSAVADARVWDLTDALLEKNENQALVTLHRLSQEGEAPHRIFGLISSQLRNVLLVQEAKSRRGPPLKINALQRQKIDRLLRNNRLDPMETFALLRSCNLRFNSSKADMQLHLEDLVMRLCL